MNSEGIVEVVRHAVDRIKDEYLLFVIAIAALLVIISPTATTLTSVLIFVLALFGLLRNQIAEFLSSVRGSGMDWPLSDRQFSDQRINGIVENLKRKHLITKSSYLQAALFFQEFESLFNRRTFYEPVTECVYQDWAKRLHAACQTRVLLEAYIPNMQSTAGEQLSTYIELVNQVRSYAEAMAMELFKQRVDLDKVEPYVGTPEFESRLKDEETVFPLAKDEYGVGISAESDLAACERPRRSVKRLVRELL